MKSIPRSHFVRIIDGDDELKKTTMSPIIAAIASRLLKKTENQCQNAACEQKATSEEEKFDLKKTRPRMKYEWIRKTI